MTTMKKVATILLALLLLMSTMSIAVSSVDADPFIDIKITATVDGLVVPLGPDGQPQDVTKKLYPGDIVTFKINIKNNFNYVAMRWPVIYPSKAYEPVIVGETDASYGNVKALGALVTGDSTIESADFSSDLITGSYGGVSYNKNNYDGLLIQWTGGTTNTGLAYYNQPSGSDCISFQLRVLEGFAGIGNKRDGIAPVTIPQIYNVQSQFYYQAIDEPDDMSTLYKMDSNTCPVTVEGITTKIIKEQASVIAKEGTDVIFDTTGATAFVYGFNDVVNGTYDVLDEDNIVEYITTTGDATYELEGNDQETLSTGAKIHAKDARGNPIGDYEIVIFGDVNGDGMINGQDATMLADAIVGEYEWSWGDVRDNATAMSCDVYGNNSIGPEDYGPVMAMAKNLGYVSQTHHASNPFVSK